MTWAIGVMPARVWARGVVSGSDPVVFGGPSDPDYARDGYSHAFADWPDYAYAQYTIQQDVKWETGFGEFVMLPGIDSTGSFVRLAVSQSSAGDGVHESFAADFCDIAIVPTSSSTQHRLLASYGDGSDGDVTVSSAVTLTRPMFYNNLTVTSTGDINTAGHAVHVAGTLTLPNSLSTGNAVFSVTAGVTGTWVTAGGAGVGGQGAQYNGFGVSAVTGTSAERTEPFCLGGHGGAGTAGMSALGGGFNPCDFGALGGPTPAAPNTLQSCYLFQPPSATYSAVGGSGGGGGGADSTAFGFNTGGNGGTGGAAGGVVQIYARNIVGGSSVAGTYQLASADGGNGTAGAPGVGPGFNGSGGDGGGGGGGALILVADYIDRAPWVFRANGGNGVGIALGGTGGAVYCYVHGTAAPVSLVARDVAAAPVTSTGTAYTITLTAIGAAP